MKQILLLLLPLVFLLRCTKYEAEYTVNCQFPYSSEARKLVITDYNGAIIGAFDVPGGSTGFNEKFKIDDENAQDTYGLHLIQAGVCHITVASHFDIPNGASVYLNAADLQTSSGGGQFVFLQIHDIESFDTLIWVSRFPLQLASHNAAEKRIDVVFTAAQGQGNLLRLRANGASEFRHLYLPESVRFDTTLRWQDFKPENPPHSIELPGDGLARYLEVNAVTPDFNHYVTLHHQYDWQNNNLPIVPEFKHPDGWPEPAAYHVKVDQSDAVYEKIFQPGETLRFNPPDFSIEDISLGSDVAVRTSGDIDLLRAHLYRNNPETPGCLLIWTIEGSVEKFKNLIVPDLGPYVPEWVAKTPFSSGEVYAYQFGKQDYLQAREGFPFRSTEPFAVARSGFVSVSKFK